MQWEDLFCCDLFSLNHAIQPWPVEGRRFAYRPKGVAPDRPNVGDSPPTNRIDETQATASYRKRLLRLAPGNLAVFLVRTSWTTIPRSCSFGGSKTPRGDFRCSGGRFWHRFVSWVGNDMIVHIERTSCPRDLGMALFHENMPAPSKGWFLEASYWSTTRNLLEGVDEFTVDVLLDREGPFGHDINYAEH